MNRRQFIHGFSALVATSALAACGVSTGDQGASRPGARQTATPFRVLASPEAPTSETTAAAPDLPVSLEQFLTLSAVLTGIDQLDPILGRVYLENLAGNGQDGALVDLVSQAGIPNNPAQSIDDLEGAGVFAQEQTGSLADSIIEMWYTGTYTVDEEPQVATFVDALAWKVIDFTKPPTICGAPGFWERNPRAFP